MLQKMYDREHGGGSGRGFAAMDDKAQREIARKGGAAVSENRQHMAEIGRKGGKAVSENRQHMAEIGRKGGEASHTQNGNGGNVDGHGEDLRH
ncbi:MAG: general stress protein [Chloroflexota bacterium]|nr:general stress protein [Chloroflexota bacterium]